MVNHVVRQGDTLYRLAQQYQTTVPLILLANAGVNPYHLQVGSQLRICAGNRWEEEPVLDEMQLLSDMQKALLVYIGWLKMYLTAKVHNLASEQEVTSRLQMQPDEIVRIFETFYPEAMTSEMRQQLADYTENMMEYTRSLMRGGAQLLERPSEGIARSTQRMAELLQENNDNYSAAAISEWLRAPAKEVETAVREALDENYTEEMNALERMDQGAVRMADYLTDGLVREFYKEG